jgi:hypothetical protein
VVVVVVEVVEVVVVGSVVVEACGCPASTISRWDTVVVSPRAVRLSK